MTGLGSSDPSLRRRRKILKSIIRTVTRIVVSHPRPANRQKTSDIIARAINILPENLSPNTYIKGENRKKNRSSISNIFFSVFIFHLHTYFAIFKFRDGTSGPHGTTRIIPFCDVARYRAEARILRSTILPKMFISTQWKVTSVGPEHNGKYVCNYFRGAEVSCYLHRPISLSALIQASWCGSVHGLLCDDQDYPQLGEPLHRDDIS